MEQRTDLGTGAAPVSTRLGSRVTAHWWQELLPLGHQRWELNEALDKFEKAIRDLRKALGGDVP
jgi:hypothetical protein